jgi:hypothetical protein
MPAAALTRLVVALALVPCAGDVWGVVLDMGSSGTRVRIHTWEAAVPMTEFVPEDDDDADALDAGARSVRCWRIAASRHFSA